jgi:hypothetical protein
MCVIQYRRFMLALKVILASNLFDAIATTLWVMGGFATEANPLMSKLLHAGPGLFIMTKVLVVQAGVMTLCGLRPHLLARLGAIGLCVPYLAVCLLHIVAAITIFGT